MIKPKLVLLQVGIDDASQRAPGRSLGSHWAGVQFLCFHEPRNDEKNMPNSDGLA